MSFRVAILASVWPEPTSSAAGIRTLGLIRYIREAGWEPVVLSAAVSNPFRDALEREGVPTHAIRVNDPGFDALISKLDPRVAIFDRFTTEEQFGWRVRKHAPEALRIVDTCDLHGLRRYREALLGENHVWRVIHETPATPSEYPDLLRELASFWRSDLSWVVSPFEYDFLVRRCSMDPERVQTLSFSRERTEASARAFEERRGFYWIGNYRHPPNLDAVQMLLARVWPAIQERLPDAELVLYGAYPPKNLESWVAKAKGARIGGSVEDALEASSSHRVGLFPLRYGAGIKGKVLEAWAAGTPVVTTSAGLEGLRGEGARAEDRLEALIDSAIELHSDPKAWGEQRVRGFQALEAEHSDPKLQAQFQGSIERALEAQEATRARNWIGDMLWMNQLRATEYFSRWIELKERAIREPGGKSSPASAPSISP